MSFLPYSTLQPTYAESFSDVSQALVPSEKVWLSLYAHNAPQSTIHAKLHLEPCKPPAEDDESKEAVQKAGGVFIAEIEGSVKVERVKGALLDLRVTTAESSIGSTSARTQQNSVAIPSTLLRTPRRTLGPLVRGYDGISAFDVAKSESDGVERYIAGSADGDLRIGVLNPASQAAASSSAAAEGESLEQRAERRIQELSQQKERERVTMCKGLVGDIRSVFFFPSGDVALSTSSDHTARIWGLDGSNPRILKGHSRAVLCAAPLGRGREVLTGSSDGTVRIWNVGEDRQTRMIGSERWSGINALALAPVAGTDASEQTLLAMGLSSGQIELQDLRSKTRAALITGFLFPPGPPPAATDSWQQGTAGAISALAWLPSGNVLFSGSLQGICAAHDLRMLTSGSGSGEDTAMEVIGEGMPPKSLISTWRRNGADITDMRFVPSQHAYSEGSSELLIATSDGLPHRLNIDSLLNATSEDTNWGSEDAPRAPRVVVEYTGWEAEPVNAIRLDERGRVLCAGAEGSLRCY